jgi:hypothetical protein
MPDYFSGPRMVGAPRQPSHPGFRKLRPECMPWRLVLV